MTTIRSLANCCQEFQADLAELAAKYGKPLDQVFTWWCQYSEDCRNFDQSAILWEFERWYEEKFKA